MPRRGKKKKGQNKKTQESRSDVRQGSNGRPSATANFVHGSPKQALAQSFAPNVTAPDFGDFQSKEKVRPDNFKTLYSRYKAATKRVVEYLEEVRRGQMKDHKTQDDKMTMNVNSLITTADWMAEANIPVDPEILKDLKCAIRVRSKVAKSFFGGGDSGHQHLLDTLVYCWKVLDSLPRTGKNTTTSSKESEDELDKNGKERFNNRYDALQETGELEREDDSIGDEEIFSCEDIRRPNLDRGTVPLKDILLDAEDRTDAGVFLVMLNDLMRCVATEYAHVAMMADSIAAVGIPPAAIVPIVLRATIATNMAIHRVQRLEIEFELQNPHISTPYRLLTLIVFPELVQNIVQMTAEHGGKACSTRDANLFLGDLLECTFRWKDDPANDGSTLVSNFCSRFELDEEGSNAINEMYTTIRCITIAEVPLKEELHYTEDIGTHEWLYPKHFAYIAGDRAIHHTIRLLQTFGYFFKQCRRGQRLGSTPGAFGPFPWERGASAKIHNDLDELLMTDLLPNLLFMCRDWIIYEGSTLPRQGELAPIWSCLRRFVRSPELAPKWSTIFAVHAMLTGILETDMTIIDLPSVLEETFNSYFHQLNVACEHKKGVDGSFDSRIFQAGIFVTRFLENLGSILEYPAFGHQALWNPVWAGTSLLYLKYQGNVEIGLNLMDDRCQLKIVLYLYHALLIHGILERDDISFLDCLYRGYEKSQVLWGGSSLPKKGKLVEQFWQSMRNRFKLCDKTIAKLSRLAGTKRSNVEHLEMMKEIMNSEVLVRAGETEPEEFSTSYRRICLRDYHDVVDCYFSKEIRQRSNHDGYTFSVQLHNTIDAHAQDSELFGYNFPACGVYLDEFVCGMSGFLEWDELFKKAPRFHYPNRQGEHPERIAEEYMFAHHLLGTLDKVHKKETLDKVREFCTGYVRPFFARLKEEQYIWIRGVHHQWNFEYTISVTE